MSDSRLAFSQGFMQCGFGGSCRWRGIDFGSDSGSCGSSSVGLERRVIKVWILYCCCCGKPAIVRCGRCLGAFYCSQECLVLAWSVHKGQCKIAVQACVGWGYYRGCRQEDQEIQKGCRGGGSDIAVQPRRLLRGGHWSRYQPARGIQDV